MPARSLLQAQYEEALCINPRQTHPIINQVEQRAEETTNGDDGRAVTGSRVDKPNAAERLAPSYQPFRELPATNNVSLPLSPPGSLTSLSHHLLVCLAVTSRVPLSVSVSVFACREEWTRAAAHSLRDSGLAWLPSRPNNTANGSTGICTASGNSCPATSLPSAALPLTSPSVLRRLFTSRRPLSRFSPSPFYALLRMRQTALRSIFRELLAGSGGLSSPVVSRRPSS
ncbi:hypothetical protein F503_04182 [Ophiostoma piceae UAMH 11346]|uniref:Uncharacterized protein n=1 Tax=Ophiostoma piceae (strain UAMH 11346) TaxID=1262450 RepID=S3D5A6_OPHP1|nr:hypothetical protein F503_04182 [Ophiostoma piceae UAMH 11346]